MFLLCFKNNITLTKVSKKYSFPKYTFVLYYSIFDIYDCGEMEATA